MITAVKLKSLAYGDAIATGALTGVAVKAHAWTPITNSHGDTFQYEEADPTVSDYINQLTGLPYRSDIENGNVQMSFVIGEYDYTTKAALQGGVATATSWVRPQKRTVVYKALKAVTDDDVVIVFPRAAIVAVGKTTDKAIGLSVVGKMMDTGVAGLLPEGWFAVSELA